MKKALSTATVALSLVGISAMAAPQALATGNDTGATTVNGNGADRAENNAATYGNMSPQNMLIQGTLNDLCALNFDKLNVGSVVGLIPITVQDINILSTWQKQNCVENSSQTKGDEPLSHVVDDIPLLSANGTNNR
ncbi:RdlA protein [Streptomyces albus subsp. chlorinus]|uniref:rodlin n=1 Tax=Streptomyces albus TaxID=1888 RepID=UPI00156F090C|nr:rodlin [Streptomyces albus]NSC23901.1 RdlA protein [Streptomyces albus subsp. chlorinus]